MLMQGNGCASLVITRASTFDHNDADRVNVLEEQRKDAA